MTKELGDTPDDAASRLFVHSLAKCFQILEVLQKAGRPLGFTEIVAASKLNRSVVQRMVHTLKALGYLRQHPDTRAYTLSSRMLSFSHTVLALDRLREKAHPYLEALNRDTGETVNLMRLEEDEIVYIARFPSHHAVSVDLHVGSRLPAFCTAAGRAILSCMDSAVARAALERADRKAMTATTVTDLPGLMAALAAARQAGYALNDQEAFVGDISIAAPLLDRQRKPVGAVNIAVPSPRWKLEDVQRSLAPKLIATAKSINASLGDL
ncbi:IclR family transcriptional regulator [Parapusillimonas granuli]|uniref:IclR family transcriptional regulator n=1 Tax=Parapusillimonas granuli TaxID=380911 RepID=A0A853FYQ8_9BURK|nr:IclR family transcriptional regulator [Parapusillimonas granuli]MBB5215580.1 DNA-binding IclR family transcriptional regulator [Parapusillimonas granuli]NYT49753.1 IclR family transcriptional regulator [Parapusillimonas granuli]